MEDLIYLRQCLASYLPYNLQMNISQTEYAKLEAKRLKSCELISLSFSKLMGDLTLKTNIESQNGGLLHLSLSVCKPQLKPLSDLTIEEMIVLAKLVGDIYNDDMDDQFECKNDGHMSVRTPWDQRIEFFWKGEGKIFTVYDTWNHCEKRVKRTLEAYKKLFEWHYDLFNLIEKDLAIKIIL